LLKSTGIEQPFASLFALSAGKQINFAKTFDKVILKATRDHWHVAQVAEIGRLLGGWIKQTSR
jgi:hypothetical protein